jgi:putative tryptophan/tyrosine transport system substrate-binding protein
MGGLRRLSRRVFVGGLAGLGVAAAGLALVSRGSLPSQPRVARIGYMWSGSPLGAPSAAEFRAGIRDAGWVDQNLVIEERTFGDHPERIPALAAELVALKPDILLTGTPEVVQAFMRASNSIPIVFAGANDPIGAGIIASYAQPGGNVTGTSRTPGASLGPKLLDLLRSTHPRACTGRGSVRSVAYAWNE